MAHARSLNWLLATTLVAALPSLASAVGWSDNFDDMNIADGNPVTWSTNLLNFFPGNYDASSGDYALSAPGEGDNNQLVTWVDNANFPNNLYLRAQGIVQPGAGPEEIGGNLALLARIDTATVSSYVLYVDDGGTMGLQLSLGGGLSNLVPTVDLPFNAASDIIIELDIVGTELMGFAWLPGESKPDTPQITASDATLASGPAGIAYDEDDDNTTGLFRFVAAQDAPFVDGVPGDYDGDLNVDGADMLVWQQDLGSTTDLAADGSNNGVVDGADLGIWQANFPQAASVGAVGAVPEPTSAMLAFAMAVAAGTAARRR